MSDNANMRAARLHLAHALMSDPGRQKDAEAELRLALAEPGEEPPDSTPRTLGVSCFLRF
jgi:hypothetical protein